MSNLVPGEFAKVIAVSDKRYGVLKGRVGLVVNTKQEGALSVRLVIDGYTLAFEQDELERVVNYCHSCGRHD